MIMIREYYTSFCGKGDGQFSYGGDIYASQDGTAGEQLQ